MKQKLKDFNIGLGQMAVIVGQTGSGKTGFASAYNDLKCRWQLKHEKQFRRKQNIIDEQITSELVEGGYTNLYTKYPNTYADFNLRYKWRGKMYQVPDFDLLRFSLPNPYYATDFFQPGADFFVDEAHEKLNNQNYYQIKQPFYDGISTDRHVGYNLICLTQLFSKLPTDIRRLTTDIYQINKLKVIYWPFTKIPLYSKWSITHYSGIEFTNYVPTKITKRGYKYNLKHGVAVPEIEFLKFTYWGNWYKLYDTHEQRYKRFRGLSRGIKFTRRYVNYPTSATLESITTYNLARCDETPEAFKLSEKKCFEKFGSLKDFVVKPVVKEIISEMIHEAQNQKLLTYNDPNKPKPSTPSKKVIWS